MKKKKIVPDDINLFYIIKRYTEIYKAKRQDASTYSAGCLLTLMDTYKRPQETEYQIPLIRRYWTQLPSRNKKVD